MNYFKQLVKTIAYSMSIIGTTIGAGFVSGKEIANFLNVYGNWAYLVAIIIGVIYFFCIKLFYNASEKNILNENKILDYIVIFTQFISLSAMLAALNSLLTDYFGSSYLFYIFCIFCFIIILLGLKGLTSTNLFLMPIVVVFILFIGISALSLSSNLNIEVMSTSPTKIASYLFIYVGLDLFGCYPICNALTSTQSKKQQTLSAFIVALCLSLLLICYLVSILKRGTNYAYFDIPILHYIIDYNDKLFIFTCIIVGIGIITTLLSNGFVIHDLSKKLWQKNSFVTFLVFFCGAYVLSFFGFSNIVEHLYPLIGLTGLGLIILLIFLIKKQKKSSRQ